MPEVAPFIALRYDQEIAGPLASLTAPPYDVVSPIAARALLSSSPYNIVRLEGDASGGGEDDHRAAGRLMTDWRRRGVLVETHPSYFAYEMGFTLGGQRRTTRGLLAALGVEPWGGRVIPHEATSSKPVAERLGRLRAVGANLSPIHVIAPGPSPSLDSILRGAAARPPDSEVTDEEGVTHRLWSIDADEEIAAELRPQTCMIADGHHRYTTALAYRQEMRAAHGDGPWDFVLALIVDASQEAPVLPFHRIVVKGTVPEASRSTSSLDETLAALDDDSTLVGVIRPGSDSEVEYGLVALGGPPPAVEALEPRLPTEEDSVRFSPDPLEADRAVRMREAVGAWLLPPTSASRIRASIDAGRRLPRKSTYFWPKPRTGFVLRPLD